MFGFIALFQINHFSDFAVTNSNHLRLSITPYRCGQGMRFELLSDDQTLWDSGRLPWQPMYSAQDLPLSHAMPCLLCEGNPVLWR